MTMKLVLFLLPSDTAAAYQWPLPGKKDGECYMWYACKLIAGAFMHNVMELIVLYANWSLTLHHGDEACLVSVPLGYSCSVPVATAREERW